MRYGTVRLWALSWALQGDTADIQILLEAIQLQEIRKFECADVSAFGAYFFLEISNHALQVLSVKAGPEELIPKPLTIEAQS